MNKTSRFLKQMAVVLMSFVQPVPDDTDDGRNMPLLIAIIIDTVGLALLGFVIFIGVILATEYFNR